MRVAQKRQPVRSLTEHLAMLQALTGAFSEALTPAGLEEIAVTRGAEVLGASAAAALLVREEDLVVRAVKGYPEAAAHSRFPTRPRTPAGDSVRSNDVVFVASDLELRERYPAAASWMAGPDATVALPVRIQGRPIGALAFGFAERRALDDDDRAFMLALGEHYGQALERTRLNVAEREARDHLAFLAEAATVLSSSLDRVETLRRLAELAVPRLGDWCAVDMIREDGSIEPVATAHIDHDKARFAEELRHRNPPRIDGSSAVAKVLRTGEPELLPDIHAETADQTADDMQDLVAQLRLRSLMIVPLAVHGDRVGAMTFAWAESGTRYTERDLALAMDLAHRASVAMENAWLYEAEREARRSGEQARRRLTLLAEAGAAFASTLDYDAVLGIVTRLTTTFVADWCVVFLMGPEERIDRVASAHRDSAKDELVRQMAETHLPEPDEAQSLVVKAVTTGEPTFAPLVEDDFFDRVLVSEEQRALVRSLGMRSLIVAPLLARARSLGALVLARADEPEPFTDEDLQLAQDLARRAAQALDNARLYGERDRVADTLQRSLLPPDLPAIPRIELGAVYRPAGDGMQVGGDFYDVFQTSPEEWTIVVGDVCGKGPTAAALTGLSRYTIRTAAMSERRPSRVLTVLNGAMLQQGEDQRFCTACYARLHVGPTDSRLTFACGGHPLPLVLRSDGVLETVGAFGPLIGVFDDAQWKDVVVDLHPRDLLVLYTDGVTDERLDEEEFGEERLKKLVQSSGDLDAQAVADRIVEEVVGFRGSPRDDIAVLALRVRP